MTRAERLFSLLGGLDDGLIEEAARPVPDARPRFRPHWARWGALCACLLLAVGIWRLGGFTGFGRNAATAPGTAGNAEPNEPPRDEQPGEDPGSFTGGLPLLPYQGLLGEEGMGDRGIWIDDADSYLSDGIDPPDGVDTLPVYASTVQTDGTGAPVSSDVTAMEALLDNILARFGLTQADCQVKRLNHDWNSWQQGEVLAYLQAAAPDGTEITVIGSLTVSMLLPWESLPQSIQEADRSTLAGMEALGRNVVESLGWLLDMEQPTVNITGGDVDLYGRQNFALTITENAGREPSDLAGANLKRAYGFGTVCGDLIVTLAGRETVRQVGDYPILSLDEAREQLLTGTWAGYDPALHTIPEAEQIVRSELVYRTGLGGVTMPYYRFYLDLGETVELMEKIELPSGASQLIPTGETVSVLEFYYVPAVEAQYLDLSA